MEIDQSNFWNAFCQNAIRCIKRGIHTFHIDDPHQVQNPDLDTPHIDHAISAPRRQRWKVCRAQKGFAEIEKVIGFFSAKGMIASSNHIHTAVKQEAGRHGRNPISICGIFPVCNDEIYTFYFFQLGQMCAQKFAANAANNVADGENIHNR